MNIDHDVKLTKKDKKELNALREKLQRVRGSFVWGVITGALILIGLLIYEGLIK